MTEYDGEQKLERDERLASVKRSFDGAEERGQRVTLHMRIDDGGDFGTTRLLICAIAILAGLLVGFLIKRWGHGEI
jgi:hypothetical protein